VYVFGEVLKAQGIKGEVKIRIISSFPEHLKELNSLLFNNDSGLTELKIEHVRITGQFAVIKFDKVTDRNSAEALQGGLLYITRDELTRLPADEFYQHDLIGLSAFDQSGRYLGKVVDIEELPAHDLLIINQENGTQFQVPFVRNFIGMVDLESEKLVINSIDGLTEV